MLAMQYSIQLPANFEPGQIRARVQARSKLFDAHRGLVHKAFLFNEEDKLYAPFYVWRDAVEARDFLMNDLFRGVVEAFNRHRVRSWIVPDMAWGNRDIAPQYAVREIDVIPSEVPLDRYLAAERKVQAALLANKGLYLHLVAVDADRWEILRYSLWKDRSAAPKPASDCTQTYEVLHVSEP